MKKLFTTLCLIVCLALGSFGIDWSGDLNEGFTAFNNGDFAKALKGWKPLAEQGDARAQFNLGLMYRKGQGVPQDYKATFKWYTLSAEQGFTLVQYNLAIMYLNGDGVLKDYVYAHMKGNIANSKGYENGKKLMEILLELGMTPSQVEKAQDLAKECIKKNYKGC